MTAAPTKTVPPTAIRATIDDRRELTASSITHNRKSDWNRRDSPACDTHGSDAVHGARQYDADSHPRHNR